MSTAQATLADLKKQSAEPEAKLPVIHAGFSDSQGFALIQRAANLLASSTLVPKDYQGNIPNCVIALNMANRIGADPLMVMQNLYVEHGRPSWSSQFLVATFNQCGRFSALRYEFFGDAKADSWGCRAWAVEKSTGEKLTGSDITIGMAKAEGWTTKNGSKWKTMPQQMLMYRAATFFVRAYAPELSMGLYTREELQDAVDLEIGPGGTYAVTVDGLKEKLETMREKQGKTPADEAPEVGPGRAEWLACEQVAPSICAELLDGLPVRPETDEHWQQLAETAKTKIDEGNA